MSDTKSAILAAFDRLDAKSKGHCGGDLCTLAGPRAVFGVCGCNCGACREADGMKERNRLHSLRYRRGE